MLRKPASPPPFIQISRCIGLRPGVRGPFLPATLWDTGTSFDIAYAVVHCTIGDGLIGATGYLLTSLILREPNWPLRSPAAGGVLIVLLGLLYTAASEWYHVHVAASRGYAQSMPTVFGVGASPLVQWLLLPPITLACYRLVVRGRQK